MRFLLPMLLLTATAAMAQPAPSDKPFIYDALPRLDLKSFKPPEAPRPLPENAIQDDRVQRCPLAPTSLTEGCGKPEAPKAPSKGVG